MNTIRFMTFGAVLLLGTTHLADVQADAPDAVTLELRPSDEQIERDLLRRIASAREAHKIAPFRVPAAFREVFLAYSRRRTPITLHDIGYHASSVVIMDVDVATASDSFRELMKASSFKRLIRDPEYTDMCILVRTDGTTGKYNVRVLFTEGRWGHRR